MAMTVHHDHAFIPCLDLRQMDRETQTNDPLHIYNTMRTAIKYIGYVATEMQQIKR